MKTRFALAVSIGLAWLLTPSTWGSTVNEQAVSSASTTGSTVSSGERGVFLHRSTINFRELAEKEKKATLGVQQKKAIHRPLRKAVPWSSPVRSDLISSSAGVDFPRPLGGTSQPLLGPVLGVSFQGLLDDERFIPPDTQGAVGPKYVMTTLNSEVRIQDRQGNIISTVTLGDFWSSLGHFEAFDPKLVYDPQARRWYFVTLADPAASSSSVMLGVSTTSDPTGDWTLFEVQADPSGVDWADYPNLAYNGKWVVVSVNLFGINSPDGEEEAPGSANTQIYVFDRGDLGPEGKASHVLFYDNGFTVVPTLTYDSTEPVMYLVTADWTDYTISALRIASVSGDVGSEVYSPNVATVTAPQQWAILPGQNLPQLGSSVGIDPDDSRMQVAVERNGTIWATHTVFLPASAPTHAAIQWLQFTPSGTLLQFGRIDDPSGEVSYAYPSIAVNSVEDAVIGYSRFSGNQYASGNYSYRYSTDPPNTMSGDVVLKEGEAVYRKDFGSGDVRWGDYSSTIVDPINDFDVWTLQEYAASPDGTVDRWGTWWGQLLFGTPDGILEVSIVPLDGSTLLEGSTQPVFVQVSDAIPVTNATVTASLESTNLVFLDDGAPPDAVAGDGIYSANLDVPTNSNDLVLNFAISAPEKTNATATVTYSVVPPPVNDYFTNAVKVASSGGLFLSNNKFATEEPSEPNHANVKSVAGSLWWNWAPVSSTSVLIDTTGSKIDTVLAVYTGHSVGALTEIAATNDVGFRKQAYLNFSAIAGQTYHIAVAGVNSNSLGSLRLRVTPSGQFDTNQPIVFLDSPLNGQWVTNSPVTVSGTANDPQPNASGINQVYVGVNGQFPTAAVGTSKWSASAGLRQGLNTIQVTAEDIAGNISETKEIQVNYLLPNPPNDLFAKALSLTTTPEVDTVDTSYATKEVGEPNHAGNAGGKSVWWTYSPPGDGLFYLSTSNSSFDTVLAVYIGSPVNNLTNVASNDDAYDGVPGGFSELSIGVRSNEIYHIAVDGYDGAAGTVLLSYSFAPSQVFHVSVGHTSGGTVEPAQSDVPSGSDLQVSATPDTHYRFDGWQGDIVSKENPLTVTVTSDLSLMAYFVPVEYSDGFESGDLSHLGWISTNNPWIVQTNVVSVGQFAARSAAMEDSQDSFQMSSLILITNLADGMGTFDYKVSSEPSFSYLQFSLNGVSLPQVPWSGDVGWANFAFPVTAGTNILRWDYVKAPGAGAGLDAAFIDNVVLPFVGSSSGIVPAQLTARLNSEGGLTIDLLGGTNQSYILQVSANLSGWQNIATNIAAGGVTHFPIADISTNSMRFYRAVGAP